MSSCKTLIRTSLSSVDSKVNSFSAIQFLPSLSLRPTKQGLSYPFVRTRNYGTVQAAISVETSDSNTTNTFSLTEQHNDDETDSSSSKDTVEKLLTNKDDLTQLMKMERRPMALSGRGGGTRRWFPYLDKFKCGEVWLNSSEVVEAVGPYLMAERKDRFVNVVKNRSYSVCLVVEGLSDFGNVSATFRSADALGVQSVHVLSCDSSKRCQEV